MATLWVYIAFDGDHIGREVERAGMADDAGKLKQLSQQIEAGNELWKSWVLANGGETISMGGDEGNLRIGADHLGDLPDLRERYEAAVGAPVSVGVGARLSEAGRALMAAKIRGGDRVVLYDPSIEEELSQVQQQTEAQKISESYLQKGTNPGRGIAAPDYGPAQREGYKAKAKPAAQPYRPNQKTSPTIAPGAKPSPRQQELRETFAGVSQEGKVLADALQERGMGQPELPPKFGTAGPLVAPGLQIPAEDGSGPDRWDSQYRPASMYQTKAASDRAAAAAQASNQQNSDIGGTTYNANQWDNVAEAALQDASPIPEIPDPSDPTRMLHFKWRIADPDTGNFGPGRAPWSRALDVWSRRIDHTGRPTWRDSRSRGFYPLTPSGFVNHDEIDSTSADQPPEHINQIIGHIHGALHAPGNNTWKSELQKDEPALNKPNAGGGMTGPSTAPAAAAASPTPEGSEHSENEALQGLIADNPAPPSPESPDMDAMHDLLGQTADAQGQQDSADQQAQQQQQDGQQGQQDLKSQVLKILKTFQDRKDELEQLAQQDPELYQSMVGMVKVLIAGAKQLFGVDGQPQGQPDASGSASGNPEGEASGKKPESTSGSDTKKSEEELFCRGCGEAWHADGKCPNPGIHRKTEPGECKHFYGNGGDKCLKCKKTKADLDKASLEAGKTGRHNVVLPPGSQKDPSASGTKEAGKIKVLHPEDGKTSWASVRAGQVLSQDGHAISSRNPGGH